MKKLFTTLLLLTAIVTAANAEMKTIWDGTHKIGNWDWNTRLELAASYFSDISVEGGNMVITFAKDVETATAAEELWYQYEIVANDYVENRDPERTTITSGSVEADGDVTIPLTAEQADLLKNYGMIINGHYVIITKIAIETEKGSDTPDTPTPDEGTTTELWSGSKSLAWDAINISYENNGALANAKIGDVITITYTNAGEGANIRISNPNGWSVFDSKCETSPAATTGEETFSYEIPNATILGIIQRDGIIITGNAVTITKVELTTYPDSYDAVAVTIGTEGIATYSHQEKTIDFTNSGIKAYYASAVEKGKVTLTPISVVPGYTGIIVKGDAGTYEIPVVANADGLGTNYLKPIGNWEQNVTASADGTYHYIFNESDATFSLVSETIKVEANKAYLETPTDITPAEGSIALEFEDEESTGISNIEVDKIEDDNYYNLQGMRVEHPSRGIYIHNGKKVIIR